MKFFGKKNKKLEEKSQDEDDKKVDIGKNFKKKDFKDLNSENKQSRREPKKPWGKYERYWVIAALGITVGISVYLWLTSMGWKLPKSDLKEINPFREETIIIEGN